MSRSSFLSLVLLLFFAVFVYIFSWLILSPPGAAFHHDRTPKYNVWGPE